MADLPTKARPVKIGEGWVIYIEGDSAWIKFNHKPDGETLVKLRRVATWQSDAKAWRAHRDCVDTLCAIGGKAVTWESVGEDPPHWLDDADYPIFH